MATKTGDQRGGIRTVEDLRLRCYCERGEGGCWHLRGRDGRRLDRPGAGTMRLYDPRVDQSVSARKLAYELWTGSLIPPGRFYVQATCGERDCVKPAHLVVRPIKEAIRRNQADGLYRTARKRAANIAIGLRRSRFSVELRRWIAESEQTDHEIAHAIGTVQSHASALRRRSRAALLGGGL